MVQAPLAIVWRCRLSVSEYVAAGKQLEVLEQVCPDCGRRLAPWSGYWRWLRAEGERLIWIRRGRCSACRRTHALLPDFVHERRLDVIHLIGSALERGVLGLGMAKVAENLGVPHSTARDWRRRHRARAPTLLAGLAELAISLGATLAELPTVAERAALVALRAAWKEAGRRLGGLVPGLWRFWNAVCGGRALATNTDPLWAAARRAAWMP